MLRQLTEARKPDLNRKDKWGNKNIPEGGMMRVRAHALGITTRLDLSILVIPKRYTVEPLYSGNAL